MRTSSLLFGLLLFASGLKAAQPSRELLLVGTYTGPDSKGIYAWSFDAASGKAQPLGLAAEIPNPSYLLPHPSGRFVYSVEETDNFRGQKTGAVAAFSVDLGTGRLKLLGEQPSGGAHPCHLALDAAGSRLLVANYTSGSAAVLPLHEGGGKLLPCVQRESYSGKGVNQARQEAPHAHAVQFSPDGHFLCVVDLGLDQLHVYRFSALNGELEPAAFPLVRTAPGAGPRHMAFHPGARYAYVVNELACTITTFAFDAKRGAFQELGTVSTLPKDFHGPNTCAEILVSPSGRTLYVSNRGHDSLAVFALDKQGGLNLLQHVSSGGKNPRHFALDPSGRYLLAANQDSRNVTVFKVDPTNGRLSPTGESLSVPSPVCLCFLPVR